jgi:hypothetical protein
MTQFFYQFTFGSILGSFVAKKDAGHTSEMMSLYNDTTCMDLSFFIKLEKIAGIIIFDIRQYVAYIDFENEHPLLFNE